MAERDFWQMKTETDPLDAVEAAAQTWPRIGYKERLETAQSRKLESPAGQHYACYLCGNDLLFYQSIEHPLYYAALCEHCDLCVHTYMFTPPVPDLFTNLSDNHALACYEIAKDLPGCIAAREIFATGRIEMHIWALS
jgi:hypothetical protein